MKNRLKSKVVWMSVLAQAIIILQITGVLSITQIEAINVVATSILQILVLFGILNNPTDSNHF